MAIFFEKNHARARVKVFFIRVYQKDLCQCYFKIFFKDCECKQLVKNVLSKLINKDY